MGSLPRTFPHDPNNLYKFVVADRKITGRQLLRKGLYFAIETATMTPVVSMECRLLAEVPERFRALVPQKYKFISRETYKRLIGFNNTHCSLKGCWDRNHCFWYKSPNPGVEWNVIPEDYVPGSEECESFINKYTMFDV